jgi:hypothetical protein
VMTRSNLNPSHLCTCYGVVSYKAPHALWPFSHRLCVLIPSYNHSWLSTRTLWQTPAETQ